MRSPKPGNEASKNQKNTQRIMAEQYLSANAGHAALKAANAAPKLGSLDYEVETLRNPQNTNFYNEAEGFVEMFEETPTLGEAIDKTHSNGVESLADGTYVLRHGGTAHAVNEQGIPSDSQVTPK